ncbi:MAG: DUF4139 domain-containing protein [Bacteroidia bacterium]|nr:DUF4139 domain-containing protein [Sphingobacteriaceae bacterium]MBK7311387.1 DUF4139 domain-containing protein [Sphingobacteriaceae bacterium]MBP9068023.1 DUF4139 domain-containing protein [Bacteroidia bacterium]
MKNILALVLCITMFHTKAADLSAEKAENEKLIKTKPDKIVVYMQGAQVHRNMIVNVVPGPNTIVFTGLENCINTSAIQVGGTGGFIITDIQHLIYYPEFEKAKENGDAKFKKYLKNISDSIVELDYILEDLNSKSEALTTEKGVLLNYNLYKGLSKKDSIAFLKDGLTFLREKLYNINTEQLKLKKERVKIQLKKSGLLERQANINNELANQNNTGEEERVDYRVIVHLIADQAGQANLNFNYYITNAGWTPSYDLRALSTEQNVKLTFKAQIHQQSGNDWSNVKLVLSTANPNRSYALPQLSPWYLGYIKPNRRDKNYPASYDSKSAGAASLAEVVVQEAEKDAEFAYNYTSVSENMIETEYEIKLNYNIPTDGKEHYAAIMVKDLKTMYRYKAIPKLNNNVYLTALIPDWEEVNIMAGNASIYYDGSYIGQTSLPSGGVEDTIQLSLGIDKNIAVKRAKVKDKSFEKFFDNDKVHQYTYEITMKNSRSQKIEIDIEDQLPLSQDKNIVIEKKELSGAKYEEISGLLTWRTTIQAKDTKKLTLSYQVKSPKNSQVAFAFN